MDDCIADWVTPELREAEQPKSEDVERMSRLFAAYADVRSGISRLGHSCHPLNDKTTALPRLMALKENTMNEPKLIDLFVIGGGINGGE